MSEINNFPNSQKETLPCKDGKDFAEKNYIDKQKNNLSLSEIKNKKLKIGKQIEQIQNNVDSQDICRNQTLILGSLEYMNVIMKIEKLTISYEKDLMEFIIILQE